MQIIKNKTIALFCAALVLCSFEAFCAKEKKVSSSKMPGWIAKPTKTYPSETYITGVGEGNSAQEAELDAIKKIASFFRQDVDSIAKASKRVSQAQSNVGDESTLKATNISQDIQSSVSIENLIAIEIKERFNDGKTFYTLALMDKTKAKAIIVSSIEANNRKIDALLKYDSDDEFSFARYAGIDLAREIAGINEKLIERLAALDPAKSDELSKKSQSKTELSQLRTRLAKQIPIYIKIEKDSESNQVKQAIAQMVKASGFNTSEDSNERYAITGKIVFESRTPKDGKTIQSIYTFEGYLKDTLLNANLMAISMQGREGAADMTDAIMRSYRAMAAKINSAVKKDFENYLNSL